jgi:NADPH:quinone reductase-like Zn-dependent oxidoreductase
LPSNESTCSLHINRSSHHQFEYIRFGNFFTKTKYKGEIGLKAMVYEKYGMTDVLSLKEVDRPSPKEDEVLIKVHAASVNSWDWDLVRGKPWMNRIGGWRKPKHPILGADISGTVEITGKGVKQLQPGHEVFGDISWCGWGGFAEYVCVKETALTLKPAKMTFEQAAAIPQAAVLALQGLRDIGNIQKGQKILIIGAGGGVGTFALQLAKWHGCEVTCVDKGMKLEMLTSLGADRVMDYLQEDILVGEQKFDVVLDVVGNRSIFDYQRVLNPNGCYVMVGGTTSLILQLLTLGPILKKRENKKMKLLLHKPNQQDQHFLQELFVAGTLRPVIDKRYTLSQVAEAIQYLSEGHAKGKVVICME